MKNSTTHTRRKVMVLPEHLATKIAAGEVIQRPESAVKELLENALDAEATQIAVTIKNGGKDFIQVADDGIGMDEADAVASFERHATSKISTYEDLEAIRTLGFRGEALASIAAVAHVAMTTCREEDDVAVTVQIESGSRPQVGRATRGRGTTITVQNLFYSVPARRKFLKSDGTEFRHVYDVVQRIALAYPEVGLEFVSDGDMIFRLGAGSLQQRVLDVFGERHTEFLIPVHEESETIRVHGFIGKPSFGQKARFNQFLFLNKRFILHRGINHAVQSAYENLLSPGTFPFFILFLEVDPHRVDVNIHPSKMEAKFDDEQGIYRFVAAVVRKVLGSGGFVPSLTLAGEPINGPDVGLRFSDRQHQWANRASQEEGWAFPEKGAAASFGTGGSTLFAPPASEQAAGVTGDAGGASPAFWQLHRKYILSPISGGIQVVDQHVAHERVIYEQAMKMLQGGARTSQQLLFPYTMMLSASDYNLLEELFPYFERLGFDMKLFGKNTAVLEGVPPDVRPGEEGGIVTGILQSYREYSLNAPLEVQENFAKSFSCKSAIKAGDALTEPEMRSLLNQLEATTMPYVCPHGRPVLLRISIDELDRRFGRK